MLCYSAVYAMALCMFVRLFVCPSQVGVLPKTAKRWITETTPYVTPLILLLPYSSFLTAKIFIKFQWSHPKRWRQMYIGHGRL